MGTNSADNDEYFDWRVKGSCSSLGYLEWDRLFFPTNGRSINKAKAFCGACPVYRTCLAWGVTQVMAKGIIAGLTEKERRRIQRISAPKMFSGSVPVKKKVVKRSKFTVS